MEEQRENRGFPIQKLPCLVTSRIIRLMETWEQIRLCLTSNKMETIIRSVNLPPMVYGCYFRDYSVISIGVDNQCTFFHCGSEVPEEIIENDLIREELSKWLKPTDSNQLDVMLSLFEKVFPIIPQSYMDVHLAPAEMRTLSIQDVISRPIIKSCEEIQIYGGREISSEDLNCILDTASCLKRLKLTNTSPPYGYYHEKLFRIAEFECPSSEWMNIEFLLAIKNTGALIIDENRFNYADLNRYLKCWVRSEIDLFDTCLLIKIEEDIPENVLFDGITRLNSNRFGLPVYLIIVDINQQQRNKPVLSIWYEEQTLKLSAWLPDHHWQNQKGEGESVSFEGEYNALRFVEKRMELEETLKENYNDEKILNKIRELNEQLEQLQDDLKFTITECI